MARTNQKVRDSKGRYIKLTVLNQVKSICNRIMLKLDAWLKSIDK
jgi:hypothetical protein